MRATLQTVWKCDRNQMAMFESKIDNMRYTSHISSILPTNKSSTANRFVIDDTGQQLVINYT